MEGTTPPLTRGIKVSYGVGQAAEGIKNGAFGVFVFFYYTQVLGLPTIYTGFAVGIALAFDAISDPLVGSLSDNWRSKHGRRHPFLYWSILPLGVAFYGLFRPPELSETGLFVWLTTFAVLTRVAMTLYHVPHVSLGAELSEDFNERTEVVAYRYFFSYVGHMLTYFLGFFVFFSESQFDVGAYGPFGLTMALVMCAAIGITAKGTEVRIPYLAQAGQEEAVSGVFPVLRRTFSELSSALTNISFRWLFCGVLVVYMMVGVDNALNLHMNTYFWELQSKGNLMFFMATPVGALIGTLFARRFTEMFDKKPSILIGTSCWALCQVLPIVLRFLGVLPENGTSELLNTLVMIKLIQGFGVVQALVAFNSMVADVVDEHELQTQRRQEGVFFSAISFSNKVTSGVGTVVAGFALALIDWPTGIAIQSAADIPLVTVERLGWIYGPIVSGFAVVSVYCYSKYSLNRARHQQIVIQLKERRAEQAQISADSV